MQASELEDILRNIWQSMLLPEDPLDGGAAREEYDFASCVDIVGPWNGVVSVECDEALARAFARTMFARNEAEVADSELFDALREVANLVGGNVKGALAGGCRLSLPRATRGVEALLLDGGQTLMCESSFWSSGRGLRVRVLAEPEGEVAP
jgi:chemotaxis protein CheX